MRNLLPAVLVAIVACSSSNAELSAPDGPDGGVDASPDASGIDAYPIDDDAPETAPEASVGMVQIGDYWIDAVEVSRKSYLAWIATKPGLLTIPQCTWNTNYDPTGEWFTVYYVNPEDPLPITDVDWCDAYAYCEAHGKRLCGRIGGGHNALVNAAKLDESQWYRACAGPDGNEYPQGYLPDAGVCSLYELVVSGSMPDCRGDEAVFDMWGNAPEWDDSCEPDHDGDGSNDLCAVHGSSSCATVGGVPRSASTSRGFRCCLD